VVYSKRYVIKVIALLYVQRLGSSLNNIRIILGVMTLEEKEAQFLKAQEYIDRG